MPTKTALLLCSICCSLLLSCANEVDASLEQPAPVNQSDPALAPALPAVAGTQILSEDFEADASSGPPTRWTVIDLGKPSATAWSIVEVEQGQALQAIAENAASGVSLELPARPDSETAVAVPTLLRWRWRVDALADVDSDEQSREGDDFAARVLVTFAERPGSSMFDAMADAAASLAGHGQVPAAAIAYVFARDLPAGFEFTSPATERVATVVLRGQGAEIGQWYPEQRDVSADFERLFGTPISAPNGVQLLTDTDDAGGRACALYDDISMTEPGS
ncbi:MAG: hypothetical protein ACI9EF_001278 [Pseudohongiellaceae bacterium]|jgi:hypothetical protein